MYTPHNMTILHKGNSGGAETWTPEKVQGVLWEDTKGSEKVRSGGTIILDDVTVYVPLERATSFKQGDVIIKGLVDDEDLEAPFTIKDLKTKYEHVVVVKNINKQDYGSTTLHHWQIGAT